MHIRPRNHSLDALRGLAILLMVLSSSISFGILPAWMYHAQVPPPNHVFNPNLPGITWVDLVFPFFLFSMGAAIPLALKSKMETQSALKIGGHIIQRYLMLILFALFTFYSRAWVMSGVAGWKEYLISIGCFLLLFFMYVRFKKQDGQKLMWVLKIFSFILAVLFLAFYPFKKEGFSLASSDIIIIVLANMALFGSLIWWLTRNHPLLRIGILPLVMAILLSAKDSQSWNSIVFNWSPLPWMYKFYYLKYLFIVLPGTIAGEWLLTNATHKRRNLTTGKAQLLAVAFLCCCLLLSNIAGLTGRWLVPNLFITIAFTLLLLQVLRKIREGADKTLFVKLAHTGIYLLILGLFFEAYEGGIKKDISTYSYYFVSIGLGFLLLLSLLIFEKLGYFSTALRYLSNCGKNPMVAYTAGNLLLIPLLKLSGTDLYLEALASLPGGGFWRGLLFTGLVSLITLYCTKKSLYWRT